MNQLREKVLFNGIEIVSYYLKVRLNGQDWEHQEKGLIAVRLLSRTNLAGMPDETEAHINTGAVLL